MFSKHMAESTVHWALCPRIAVIASPDVDDIAKMNGLSCAADLLRPFESASKNSTFVVRVILMRQSIFGRPSWNNAYAPCFLCDLICWMNFPYLRMLLCLLIHF